MNSSGSGTPPLLLFLALVLTLLVPKLVAAAIALTLFFHLLSQYED